MTEGSSGLKEQITVGFLELADDLTQRLPVSFCDFSFTSFLSFSLMLPSSPLTPPPPPPSPPYIYTSSLFYASDSLFV